MTFEYNTFYLIDMKFTSLLTVEYNNEILIKNKNNRRNNSDFSTLGTLVTRYIKLGSQ